LSGILIQDRTLHSLPLRLFALLGEQLMKYILSLVIITSLCVSNAAMSTDFYVNPKGNDSWSGTIKQADEKKTDGPFKTLEKAKQAIRTLKQTNTFNDKVTVNIATGSYYLSQPLNFNLMDSGLAGKEVLWQGESGAQVTISAGMPITCKKRDATFWDCPLTKLPVNNVYFDTGRIKGNTPKFELYVNDQKMDLARWPDHDWAHIKLPLDQKTQFSVMETMPILSGDIKTAQVHIFPGNDWYDQYLGIDSFDKTANTIKLSSPTSYALDSGRRFYIQNHPSLLNAPGEWLFDTATKKISFAPPADISPNKFMLSSLPNLINVDAANHLTFKNISFEHSTGNAITIKNSNDVVLDQLDVNNIGGKGVLVTNGQNVQINNSKVHHTGGDGVDVSGGDRKTLQASNNVIYNNYIHHTGTELLTSSPGIRLSGVGNKVLHNLLEQGAAQGIILHGNEHLIEKNELHHFCLQASDCGAVYTGRDWSARGNIIRYNYIHDIIGFGMNSVDVANNQVVYQSPNYVMGVYLDDGASGFDVSGNIFENAGSRSIHINGGRDNKIYNNYFKTSDFAIWLAQQSPAVWDQNQKKLDDSPYKTPLWVQKYPELAGPMHNKTWPEGNRIERNIIVTSKPDGNSFRYNVPSNSTVIGNNIIWSTTGKLAIDYKIIELNKQFGKAPWSQWTSEGIEQHSIVANPCVTIENKKMTTCPSSPIKDIGFVPLPNDIGLIP